MGTPTAVACCHECVCRQPTETIHLSYICMASNFDNTNRQQVIGEQAEQTQLDLRTQHRAEGRSHLLYLYTAQNLTSAHIIVAMKDLDSDAFGAILAVPYNPPPPPPPRPLPLCGRRVSLLPRLGFRNMAPPKPESRQLAVKRADHAVVPTLLCGRPRKTPRRLTTAVQHQHQH